MCLSIRPSDRAQRADRATLRCTLLPLCLLLLLTSCTSWNPPEDDAQPEPRPGTVRGVVFLDEDFDARRGPGEPGIANVAVSNGREVVRTDAKGRYTLPLDRPTLVFVVKPTGYMTSVDSRGLPRFFYVYAPEGSPEGLRYPGHRPSGPPPRSLDFGLLPYEEDRAGEPFRALFFGDTQPRDATEIDYIARDIVAPLRERDVAFGLTLGDVVYDDLSLFEPLARVESTLGVPWYHVHGNHDMNLDAPDDRSADDSFERLFGPGTYAFEQGGVHFFVLDDVIFDPAGERWKYRGGLTDDQLVFIEQYLSGVPKSALLVFTMHIPLVGPSVHQVPERDRLFALIADRPHQLSISAHSHLQTHYFLGPESGNLGPLHHHANLGTTSGSWWSGAPDESGIPHTTMRCGAPNGYVIGHFEGARYRLEFRAARRPASHQMNVYAPDRILKGETPMLRANVFMGSERTRVETRVVRAGAAPPPEAGWRALDKVAEPDPAYVETHERESLYPASVRRLPKPVPSPHLWATPLPALPQGAFTIEVRALDWDGQRYFGQRAIRVDEPPKAR